MPHSHPLKYHPSSVFSRPAPRLEESLYYRRTARTTESAFPSREMPDPSPTGKQTASTLPKSLPAVPGLCFSLAKHSYLLTGRHLCPPRFPLYTEAEVGILCLQELFYLIFTRKKTSFHVQNVTFQLRSLPIRHAPVSRRTSKTIKDTFCRQGKWTAWIKLLYQYIVHVAHFRFS